MKSEWPMKVTAGLMAVVCIPVFAVIEYFGTSSFLTSCLYGIPAAAGAIWMIASRPVQQPRGSWAGYLAGSLIFACCMIIATPGFWSLSWVIRFPWLCLVWFALASFGTGWLLINLLMRLMLWLSHRQGTRSFSSYWILGLLSAGFAIVFGVVRIFCHALTTALMSEPALSSMPVFPGILYKALRAITSLFHAGSQMTLSAVVWVQILVMALCLGRMMQVIYAKSRKIWPVILGTLLVVLCLPIWVEVYALNGVIWTVAGLLLCISALPCILMPVRHPWADWILMILGMLLLSVQEFWGIWATALVSVCIFVFHVWKHPASSFGLLLAGAVCFGLGFFGWPLLGIEAQQSGLLAVPLEQIMYIAESRELSNEQSVTLSQLAPLPDLQKAFGSSDPDAFAKVVEEQDSWKTFTQNPSRYFSLYTTLILHHPADALIAAGNRMGSAFHGSLPDQLLNLQTESEPQKEGSETADDAQTDNNDADSTEVSKESAPAESSVLSLEESLNALPAQGTEKQMIQGLLFWQKCADYGIFFLLTPGFQLMLLLFVWICDALRKNGWSFCCLYVLLWSLPVLWLSGPFRTFSPWSGLLICTPLLVCASLSASKNGPLASADIEKDSGGMKKLSERRRKKMEAKIKKDSPSA